MHDRQDIRIGRAVVKSHRNGGWALPGRKTTRDQYEAVRVAMAIDQIIGDRPLEHTGTVSVNLEGTKSGNARKHPLRRSGTLSYTKPLLYD